MPPRYLVAYLVVREPDRVALLRFPPGVTLEDAGYDWASMLAGVTEPDLPADVLGRLPGIGVEVVATGPGAVAEALRRARSESVSADPGAFAEDYLDANARLGGDRCVTAREYAMHTYTGGVPLHAALRDCLLSRNDVCQYCGAAFRAGGVPGTLRLRVMEIADELPSRTETFVPCLLHGVECGHYVSRDHLPRDALDASVLPQYRGARVAVPRQLLDDLRGDNDTRARRATRAVARIILDALPEDAWVDARRDNDWQLEHFLRMVAAASAETCEEYKMLLKALEKCRSPREAVQKSRDASWVVSRTLENLKDGW